MKRLFTTSIFLLLVLLATAQVQFSRVKLYVNNDQLKGLASQGLRIDHGIFKAGAYVITELSADELKIAQLAGIRYDMIIDDMTKFYADRNAPYMSELDKVKEMKYELSRDWPVPEGFELGTCGGFLTIDQFLAHLDDMASAYPDLITPKATLNYNTHNGRQLYWVKISDNPNVDEEGEPEVLYTGMHHAREAIGMQALVYFMYYLLENYDTDPDVKYIVDNFELYFVPILNMDGYAYNIQNQPGGGGMWRKNRRQNDDGSYGVDINRNYGYMWGYDDNGSSPIPEDDTYRGPYAFSEPEIQCVKDFCEAHNFVNALNYHSYSGLLLYPWGWTDELCEHDAIFHAHGAILTTESGYTFGPGYTTIYATNGGSDDWMYGEQETKNYIYSYTPEMGNGDDGFWPSVSRIIPLCQQGMYQNMMLAKLAGPYATARDMSPNIIENTNGLLFFEIERLGLKDGATYTVSIEPLNDAIATISEPFVYPNLEILETASAAFTYTLKDDIQSGDPVDFLLSVNNGLATFSDTIHKIYGTPTIIFADSATTFTNWASSKWNTTTVQYHSSPKSIADSPTGDYSNNENNVMTLTQPIDLTGAVYASLNFWAKWDVELGYDYVQVLISDNNGASWTAVGGKYTHPGNSNQAEGQPLYDGVQDTWVKEEISLVPYIDKQIKIRFRLVSDVYVTGDGFYWDDMTVTIVEMATGIGENEGGAGIGRISVYPNPASGNVTVNYSKEISPESGHIKIYDLQGRMVYQSKIDNTGRIKIDIEGWVPGIYFCCFEEDQTVVASGKIVVK